MKRSNNLTNQLIKWAVVAVDFMLLNSLLLLMYLRGTWPAEWNTVWFGACNLSLLIGEWQFPQIVHLRMISAGDIIKRVVQLTMLLVVGAYVFIKVAQYPLTVGYPLLGLGTVSAGILMLLRLLERQLIKWLRSVGRNTRMVTFVGSDKELTIVYNRLIADSTTGYRFLGYYADHDMEEKPEGAKFERLGTVADLLTKLKQPDMEVIGDELYLCVSRRESDLIRLLSKYCERHMKRFYFVPVAEETQRVSLRREEIEDLEIYAAYESPLLHVGNKVIKRLFDILFSVGALLFLALLWPIIAMIIKCQSPGPILFRQARTGLDGKTFILLKFRSMHVNAEADSLQATKNDPRKFPFGDWMRRTNIDELPQFWNVLKGDMSIVGPRPHMLAHTIFYSEQIDKYMVRHFVKPGITGWAQVTGYRGETSELWQMEGRVKRDIWYMEHWTFWLDIRIIWKTVKAMFLSNNKGAC